MNGDIVELHSFQIKRSVRQRGVNRLVKPLKLAELFRVDTIFNGG